MNQPTPETQPAKKKRTRQILRQLTQTYPNAHCQLHHQTPLQLLIATILSAQTTDKQVNQTTPTLFQHYPDTHALANAPLHQIQNTIRHLGLYRTKAKNIQATCQKLITQHNNQIPQTMNQLLTLPGVGRKTANVLLGNAFHINHGIVVDTHVTRLAQRLHLTQAKNPQKIETDLQTLIPQPQWTQISHQLIAHGRRRCTARKPDCPHCELRPHCPSKQP